MTSIIERLQRRQDVTTSRTPTPAQRVLTVATAIAVVTLVFAFAGLAVDHRTIGGEPAWVKPAKFGLSFVLYLWTLRWVLGMITGHRRLTTAVAIVVTAVFVAETVWIDLQVVRHTTSHFNTATGFDAAAYNGAGAAVSFIFMATLVVAVLALRTRGLDAGVAAGIRWGLGVCALGMATAVSMLLNGHTDTTSGAHTVGAPDGGPGLPLTGWSLDHGDLRIGHFLGLHALQLLPVVAWLLLRYTRLDQWTRRDLVRIAGVGTAALVVLVWWQAERGQALLRPDALTLGAVTLLALGAAGAAAVVVRRSSGRQPTARPDR